MLLGAFAYLSSTPAAGRTDRRQPAFFGKQIAAAIFVAVYAFVVTWVILKVINYFEPIRVPDEVERLASTPRWRRRRPTPLDEAGCR